MTVEHVDRLLVERHEAHLVGPHPASTSDPRCQEFVPEYRSATEKVRL